MTKTDSVCIKVGSYVTLILIQLPLPVQPNVESRENRKTIALSRGSLNWKTQSLGGRK